jgi:hypothetical protein
VILYCCLYKSSPYTKTHGSFHILFPFATEYSKTKNRSHCWILLPRSSCKHSLNYTGVVFDDKLDLEQGHSFPGARTIRICDVHRSVKNEKLHSAEITLLKLIPDKIVKKKNADPGCIIWDHLHAGIKSSDSTPGTGVLFLLACKLRHCDG